MGSSNNPRLPNIFEHIPSGIAAGETISLGGEDSEFCVPRVDPADSWRVHHRHGRAATECWPDECGFHQKHKHGRQNRFFCRELSSPDALLRVCPFGLFHFRTIGCRHRICALPRRLSLPPGNMEHGSSSNRCCSFFWKLYVSILALWRSDSGHDADIPMKYCCPVRKPLNPLKPLSTLSS